MRSPGRELDPGALSARSTPRLPTGPLPSEVMTMKAMKRLIALGLVATFLSLQVHPAVFADDSDIFGANIQPNVVIMIDNSGSMADSAPSNSFDVPPPSGSAAYYPVLNNCDPSGKGNNKTNQPCASVKVYKSGSSSTYTTTPTMSHRSPTAPRTPP